jgi:glucose/arabinose dehydrogenase
LRVGRLGIIGAAGVLVAIAVAIAAAGSGSVVGPMQNGTSGNGTPYKGAPATNVTSPQPIGGFFHAIADSNLPKIKDSSLRVEKVIEGLALPTSMAFIDDRTLLILQKDDGEVRLVSNGILASKPVATFKVENASERGLLGIAAKGKDIFIYLTEDAGQEVRSRVYRFTWQDGTLAGKTMILDLPGTPGPNHDGGKMTIGPGGALYVVKGDLNREGVLQNRKDGPGPDDTSVIMKVDRDGKPLANVLSGPDKKLAAYYAYGIRNSFGLAFDPVTGALWETENGPESYDEINVVTPGFNSGWKVLTGPMRQGVGSLKDLVQFAGSHYADPVFSWAQPIGVTDIAFAGSGLAKYTNDIFVGEINGGNLYHFKVNDKRDGLVLSGPLSDKVANDPSEASAAVFGTGFGGITDIKTGPDGNLYILSYGNGSVYRIIPDR